MPFTLHGIFPNYYDETWVSYTFKSLLENMQSDVLEISGLVGSKAKTINKQHIQEILPLNLQRLFRIFGWKSHPENLLHWIISLSRFKAGDIAYMWLTNPPSFCNKLRSKDVLVVREMINCTLDLRRNALKQAYLAFDGSDYKGITDTDIDNEKKQLLSADFIYCPNPFVKQSVMAYGVPEWRCIECSYGWSPQRLKNDSPLLPKCEGITLLFVGTVDVRKGSPVLLEAWAKSGVKGRLILAGHIDPDISKNCKSWLERNDVVCLGHVEDVGAVYQSADIFCFMTWEEGGPIVTIEAMSQGLPVIVTPMGTAGLFSADEDIGLIVQPGNVDELINAIRLLSTNEELRKNMGKLAKQRAEMFTWEQVGKKRLDLLLEKRDEWLSNLTVKL